MLSLSIKAFLIHNKHRKAKVLPALLSFLNLLVLCVCLSRSHSFAKVISV